MTPDLANDFRAWLREPEHAATQREPLPLNADQQRIATTRTRTGYRRVRGPAGCGKSLALAARASQLAGEGKDVLVVSFNITLLHYLRDLAVRYPHPHESVIRGHFGSTKKLLRSSLSFGMRQTCPKHQFKSNNTNYQLS
jgi:hypothetical protein